LQEEEALPSNLSVTDDLTEIDDLIQQLAAARTATAHLEIQSEFGQAGNAILANCLTTRARSLDLDKFQAILANIEAIFPNIKETQVLQTEQGLTGMSSLPILVQRYRR
jgi:hypothetical protein